MTFLEFHNEAQTFLQALFADLSVHQITLLPEWVIDHLCYRVDSLDLYEKRKADFANFAELLIESEVNGRLIATYKLHQGISFRGWQISVVELPAPKKSKPTPTGFEHIEVVSPLSLSELEEKYKHLTLDRSGLKKELNPELEICLGPRNLKFHPLPLESVIEIEKGQKNRV